MVLLPSKNGTFSGEKGGPFSKSPKSGFLHEVPAKQPKNGHVFSGQNGQNRPKSVKNGPFLYIFSFDGKTA